MTTRTPPAPGRDDSRVAAARESEHRLFTRYGLDAKEHYVEVDEAEIPKVLVRVLTTGDGPPVLIVPGGVGDAWMLAPPMAQLKGRRIITVNRPGAGMSDTLDYRPVDFRRFAVRTLTAVLDAFEVESAPVVGNSMGGLRAFWLALDQPGRVEDLVQLGAPALAPYTGIPLFLRLMSVPGLNRLLVKLAVPRGRIMTRRTPRLFGHALEVGAGLSEEEVECLQRFARLPAYGPTWQSLMERMMNLGKPRSDVRLGVDELARIQQRVLFIWGENDPHGGPTEARQVANSVPHATLSLFPGGGHHPWWDDAEECGRLTQESLVSRAANL